MKNHWKRLLFAAVISSSVFVITWIWYQSSEPQNHTLSNEKPLAYVGKVVDDIQRRPSSRLLWQEVNGGEPLYNGEAIRTSERGEVRIQFTDSDRYLDLEPESLIVIKKSADEIALDLMEGSLFVNARADEAVANAPGLVLNGPGGKVDLSKATASLSKGQGSSVDVQVLEGQASMKSSDGKSKSLTSGTVGSLGQTGLQFEKSELKVLSPSPRKPISMDAENPKPVLFQWEGLTGNNRVFLSVGPTRKSLKELTRASVGDSSLSATLPFGRHFWKLTAQNDNGDVVAESPIYRTQILARYAPVVSSPAEDEILMTDQESFDVPFQWQKSEGSRQVTLEVWSDADLKNRIVYKNFENESNFVVPALTGGTYYWRMTSFFENSDTPLVGQIEKFTLTSEAVAKAPPPPPAPQALDIQFSEDQLTQYYVDRPQVDLSWNPLPETEVASWRVKLYDAEEGPETAIPLNTPNPRLSTPVAKPGRYLASIEALDVEGQIVGISTPQSLTVAPRPLLSSPQLLPLGQNLQASMDGRTQLTWESISEAEAYWLVIRRNGKEMHKTKYTKPTVTLKNLLPGDYEVEVSAIDRYGRRGEPSPPRKLSVPDKSSVRAPTLKKIKVN